MLYKLFHPHSINLCYTPYNCKTTKTHFVEVMRAFVTTDEFNTVLQEEHKLISSLPLHSITLSDPLNHHPLTAPGTRHTPVQSEHWPMQ